MIIVVIPGRVARWRRRAPITIAARDHVSVRARSRVTMERERERERASVRIHAHAHRAGKQTAGLSVQDLPDSDFAVPPNIPPDRDRPPRPCDRPVSSEEDEEERREQTGRSAFPLICIIHPFTHPSVHPSVHPSDHSDAVW